jgi:hypothetical protein
MCHARPEGKATVPAAMVKDAGPLAGPDAETDPGALDRARLKSCPLDRLELVLCLVLATLFVVTLSYSTSPLYANYFEYAGTDSGDSAHFMTIAQCWTHGKIPYRDAFDHKGPLLYLINFLGFLLGGGTRYGIMAFQVASLAVALAFFLKTLRLADMGPLGRGIGVALMLLTLSFMYYSGNMCQEYSLPFTSIALYGIANYLTSWDDAHAAHDPRWAFAYGLCFGAEAMILLSNVLLLSVGVLCVICVLVSRRRWSNLAANVGAGLAGVAVVVVPFVAYFAAVGAFDEFLFCTLTFNFSYSGGVGSWHQAPTATLTSFVRTYYTMVLLVPAGILAWMRKKRSLACMMFLACILEFRFFDGLQLWPQYSMAVLPQLALVLGEASLAFATVRERRDAQNGNDPSAQGRRRLKASPVAVVACVMAAIIVGIAGYSSVRDADSAAVTFRLRQRQTSGDVEPLGYEEIVEPHLDEMRDSSVTVYGIGPLTKGFYLRYDIIPNNRFSLIQDWMVLMDPDVLPQVRSDFSEDEPEYVLCEKNGYSCIEDYVARDYVLVDENDRYALYERK